VTARFPSFGAAGGYESFYLRAVDPERPRAIWLRHTVHQAPGEAPVGSVWLTLFDAAAPAPVARKITVPAPSAGDGWLRVGDSVIGPGTARGTEGDAVWDLAWSGDEAPLRHLPLDVLYSAPFPRTKLESPQPAVTFRGGLAVGGTAIALDGWLGMVGHNWGAQHAERWVWLHGTAFDGAPDAWLDLSIGRVRIGRVTTPWIVNGAVSIGGRRLRVGGIAARPVVGEQPLALDLRVPGRSVALELTARSPAPQTVVWRYADPHGPEHHVANCSIAALDVVVRERGHAPVALRTAHGGTYELGMRETTHGLPVQPFGDP
jgi:hypothetical protein